MDREAGSIPAPPPNTNMTIEQVKEIYKIQSRNVRHLKKVKKNLTIDINNSLLKGDEFKVRLKTNFLSLLYSALSEAQFVQILYTPYGFRSAEIQRIKNERAIFDKWKLMIDIALDKVGNYQTNSDLRIKRDKIRDIIDEYIEKPQLIRNKIAHGQWVHALNNPMTGENVVTTSEILRLDVVEVSKWFEIHQYLCFIVRDLIQSPSKGFHNNYWVNYTRLEEFFLRSSSWTLEKRIDDIKRKYRNRTTQA